MRGNTIIIFIKWRAADVLWLSSQHSSFTVFLHRPFPLAVWHLKRVWWNVFLLFLLWAFALSPIIIKNRRVTHLCHVPECNAELEYFSSCSILWCGDITVLHHRWKPNKMSHYSRFKATVGALSEWLSSVLIADIECWKSGVSALHPPAAADQTPFGFCSTTAFHSKSSKSHFSPVKGHRMHDLNYTFSFKIQGILKKEWEESGSHRLCLFFFSTKIQVSCRFCHFSQQSTKHRNQFGSARRLHNFRQRGIFTEVSYVQDSNGYINSEGSSAVTCCHMLPSDYQRPADSVWS